MTHAYSTAREAWEASPGILEVLSEGPSDRRYGADTGQLRRALRGTVRVGSAEGVVHAVRIAHRFGQALHPISTGQNWGYGTALPARDGCWILDLSAMRTISNFDPQLGVVTLEPGVTQADLDQFLAAHGPDFMVPVTGAGPSCSVVGNALERGYGITPVSDHFAAVTDIEAVLADGTPYRTAMREAGCDELARLFKWGVGPYTAGLFSQGGFGVVTRMTIHLARRPERVMVGLFSLSDPSPSGAIGQIRSTLEALPGIVGGLNVMNQRRVLAMVAPYPHTQVGPDGVLPEATVRDLGRQFQILPWTGFFTLYGSKEVVAGARRVIKRRLAGTARRLVFMDSTRSRWLAALARTLPGDIGRRLAATASTLRSALDLAEGHPNETALPLAYWLNPEGRAARGNGLDPARDGCGLLWYAPLVPMRRETVEKFLAMSAEITARHGIEHLVTLTSQGHRLFDCTMPLLFDAKVPGAAARAQACLEALVSHGQALGCFPYRFGHGSMGLAAQAMPQTMDLHRRLRISTDPDLRIDPGRYLADQGQAIARTRDDLPPST